MTRISYLRSYVQIGTALVLSVALLNGALLLLDKTPAMDWLPARLTGGGFVEDIQQRIAGATEAYRNGSVASDKYLCVLVGISELREAADLKVLSIEAGNSWRFLGGAGAGLGVAAIRHFADLFINSSLRPDLVVIGLNPVQFLDAFLPNRIERVSAAERKNATWYETAVDLFKRSIWVRERRKDISLAAQDALHIFKAWTLQQFGVSAAAIDPRSPWREMVKVMGTDRFPDRVVQKGLVMLDLAGAFKLDTYVNSTEESRSILYAITRSFRSRGAKVIIALMPGQSLLESREPPGLYKYMGERINQDLNDPGVIVKDYRGKVADNGFVDLVHMNPSGSAAFSRLLGKDIGTLSMSQPPLMSRR
jgi:hypothetical protein